ncbi:MAG: glycosyltransferase family 4 protein, partial [Clostridiales bacterium]|nr:glycosyltransferase family 4 protein [Clostridiales bacterium]
VINDKIRGKNYHPQKEYTKKYGNATVKIYCPPIFTLTSGKRFGVNFAKLYLRSFCSATRHVVEKKGIKPDAFYGHFIYPAGLTAATIGKINTTAAFFAYGESSMDCFSGMGIGEIREILKTVNGVVSVSSSNRKDLVDHGIILSEKIGVFPNAINTKTFFVQDKYEVRRTLNFSDQDFIVAFVGHFSNRKGSQRLSSALDMVGGIKSIFIGKGQEEPNCDGILFKGALNHEQINQYLNAADVFVLPTLAEGCCNAIIEAMACGLPIISSDMPFNDDILDKRNSIRVDPHSVEEIANAIQFLRDNPEIRNKMSTASLEKAKTLGINERAIKITQFIRERSGF